MELPRGPFKVPVVCILEKGPRVAAIAQEVQYAYHGHLFLAAHSAYHGDLFIFWVPNPLTTGTFFQSRPHGHLRVILVPRAPFAKVPVGNSNGYHGHLFCNRNDTGTFAKGARGSGIG